MLITCAFNLYFIVLWVVFALVASFLIFVDFYFVLFGFCFVIFLFPFVLSQFGFYFELILISPFQEKNVYALWWCWWAFWYFWSPDLACLYPVSWYPLNYTPPYCTLYTWLATTHYNHFVTNSCKNITGDDMDSAVKEAEEAIKEHCKEVNTELEMSQT